MNCPMANLPPGSKREVRTRRVEVGGTLNIECLKFLLGIKTCRVYLSMNFKMTDMTFDLPFPCMDLVLGMWR